MTLRQLAWMGALAMTVPAVAAAADREETKLVARATDPASGAEIRIFTGEDRELRLEVQNERVFVSKRVVPSGIEVTVRAGADTMTIALAATEMSLSGSAGRFRVVAGRDADLAKARGMIARSPAVSQAVALLARVRVRQDSPLHQAILSTRAWLESATGPSAAAGELVVWHRQLQERAAARRVSFQDGPGECWDKYAKEAIRVAKDLDECMKDVSWYEIFDALGCSTVYDLRAIGAFIWYLNCIGAMSLF